MSDPRIPEGKQDEAALPDDLDQTPASGPSREEAAQHGSEDAQLIGGESAAAAADSDDRSSAND
ncbi:MAG TPA: hypothetical protein VEW04_02590 [Allosphingosinicella sp.]|nr:hypothetical protein [Allosphingosinicella sp.]